jgi:hypothetical protein
MQSAQGNVCVHSGVLLADKVIVILTSLNRRTPRIKYLNKIKYFRSQQRPILCSLIHIFIFLSKTGRVTQQKVY